MSVVADPLSTGPPSTGVTLPAGYGALLAQVKAEVAAARVRATRAANAELLALNWRIGRLILDQQDQQGWGAKVIERLSADLQVLTVTVVDDGIATLSADDADLPIGRLTVSAAGFDACRGRRTLRWPPPTRLLSVMGVVGRPSARMPAEG